jgi:hypothetical protein
MQHSEEGLAEEVGGGRDHMEELIGRDMDEV